MTDPAAHDPGLMASLRGVADALVRTVQDRCELFAVELHEEKIRFVRTLVWVAALTFSAMMALVLGSATVVALCPPEARPVVLGGLTGFYVLGGVGLWLGFRRFLDRQSRPFAATLGSLTEDRACIRGED